MKNKKLFLKIYISFVIVITIALIVLQILGFKKRIGYLTEFQLNIDKILELNNLRNMKSNFIVDNKSDEKSLNNYLLTNENITNYIYHFKIGYYDKVFKHSDIYGVYPDLSNLPDFVREAEMDAGGSPYGNLVSDKIIEEDKIDNINYILKLKIRIIYFVLLVFLIIIIYYNKYIIDTNIYKIINNFFTEKRFIILIIFIGFLLFIFQFWLGFPGWFQNIDVLWCMFQAINNSYNNWHPIIISLTLHFLYKIFGYHSYYLFLINLLLFYLGLVLITISLYYRFKTKKIILLYFLILIKELFFMNFAQDKDATASLFVWLLFSLIFFQLLIPISNKYIRIFIKIFTGIILLFGLLWRHNMIITIYPIFILITYLCLKTKQIKNIRNYIKLFVLLMLLYAFILIAVVKIFPMLLEDDKRYPTKHLFLLQIAACIVPANDYSLIPTEWYNAGKTFEDIKKTYNANPMYADKLSDLTLPKLPNLKRVWIKSILKHPINYIKHINRFLIEYITTKDYYPIYSANEIQGVIEHHLNSFYGKATIYKLNENEQKITFTTIRYKIYDFLFNNTIHIPIIFHIIISFAIFTINFILIFIKNIFDNDILIYSFSVSLSAIVTYIIVASFTPVVLFRYIYPIYPISIISLISCITFIYDRGGCKRFFKELRGSKK